MKKAIGVFLVCLFALFAAELFTRFLGYYPFNYSMKGDKIADVSTILPEPYFATDSLIGYSLKPGRYSTLYESGFAFSSTHNSEGNRFTRLANTAFDKTVTNLIHIYGDSYFYGFGLEDTATFGYKLQQKLNGARVVNRAVMGHSAVTSLLRLRSDIATNSIPRVAIVLFTDNDIDRCVFSKSMERNISVHKSKVKSYTYPYARLEQDSLIIDHKPLGKKSYWLSRHLAVINLIETAQFDQEDKSLNKEKVHQQVFREIVNTCRQNQIVLCLISTARGDYAAQQKQAFEKENIPFVDVSDLLTDEYTLLPYDRHPNGLANSVWLERSLTILDTILN
jgi:hypothetical protein